MPKEMVTVQRRQRLFHTESVLTTFETCEADLEEIPFASGGMREVFRLRLSGYAEQFVAKRMKPNENPSVEWCWDVQDVVDQLSAYYNSLRPPHCVTFLSILDADAMLSGCRFHVLHRTVLLGDHGV